MIVYTVHEPVIPAQTPAERADEVVFVREGFTWWGFLYAPFWLLYNALWLEFAVAVLVAAAVASVLTAFDLKDQAWSIAYVLLMPVAGFEGNSLRRGCLERKGYIYLASVAGGSLDECERRFFDAWLPGIAGRSARLEPRPVSASTSGSAASWPGTGVIGTLPGEIL
jgi:Protein of unknown function (DUF2628)